MFTEYFRFNQAPFNLADNTTVFFADDNREKVCQQILCNLEAGVSPILLTGVQGIGKSQLLRHLATLWPSDLQKIKPFNSCLSYMHRVIMSFDLMADSLHNNTKLLLVVDNADEITDTELKALFSIPERHAEKIQSFQMIWCGSDDLEARLNQIDDSKFQNPYPYRYRLDALEQEKVKDYIELHLKQCGYRNEIRGELFSPAAITKITQLSQGRPYAINLLCSASLLVTCLDRQNKVSEHSVDEASLLCFSNYAPSNAPSNKPLLNKHESTSERITFQDLHKISKRSKRYHRQMKQWTQYLSNQQSLSGHLPSPKTRQFQYPFFESFSWPQLLAWRAKIKHPFSLFTTIIPGWHKLKQGLIEKLSFFKPSNYLQRLSHSKFGMIGLMILSLCAIGLVSFRAIETPDAITPNAPASVTTLSEALPATPAISPETPVESQNKQIKIQSAATDATDVPATSTIVKNITTKTDRLAEVIPTIQSLPKIEQTKHPLTLTHMVNIPKDFNRHPEPKSSTTLSLTRIVPPKAIAKAPKQSADTKTTDNAPKLLKAPRVPVLAKQPPVDKKENIMATPPKQTVAVLDEQEKATRDRAASRLNLDKQGIEFNVDALMVAAQKGDLRTVKLLIAGGIPPDIKSRQGQTALMTATRHGQQHIVKALLSLKAQPNVHDKLGWTALKYAEQHRQSEIGNLLVSAGAHP